MCYAVDALSPESAAFHCHNAGDRPAAFFGIACHVLSVERAGRHSVRGVSCRPASSSATSSAPSHGTSPQITSRTISLRLLRARGKTEDCPRRQNDQSYLGSPINSRHRLVWHFWRDQSLCANPRRVTGLPSSTLRREGCVLGAYENVRL